MNRKERRSAGKQGGADPRLQQGLTAFQAGQLAEAENLMAAVLKASPREPVALHVAGLVAFQQGRADLAVERLAASLQAKPDYAEAQNNLGRILLMLDRPAEAAERFRAALRHAPGIGEIHLHLGEALLAERQVSAAASALRQAAVLEPGNAGALSGLGTIALALGDAAASVRWHAAALALDPGFSPSLRGIGEARLIGGDPARAIERLEAGLQAMPDDAAVLGNLAVAWREAGRLDRGLAIQRRILCLNPAHPMTLGHLAQGLLGLGRAEEAFALARRRLATDSSEVARKALRATQLYVPGRDPHAAHALLRRIAPAPQAAPAWRRAPEAGRPLTIAYVSSDFRDHPIARSLLPVIAVHDRSRVRPLLYGEVAREDAVTRRFRDLAPYRSTIGASDASVAAAMRDAGVDIAVFVAGSFDANRLDLAAQRCAPLQISLHDAATSGSAAIDYLIADRFLVERDERDRFAERVLCLPHLYLHAPIEGAPDPALPDGPPVFAASANPAKLNRDTLALWAEVLAALPEARLLLKYRNAFREESLRAAILEMLPAGRVGFASGTEATADHLDFYRQVHAVLDTAPFSGSTSSFEALWMGVPVVTLAGGGLAERWTGDILHAIGRDSWIAPDRAGYVRRAIAIVTGRPSLARERTQLRSDLLRASVTDGARRTRQLERLYRAIWDRYARSINGASTSGFPAAP
jgi:protein O-GlcNAc transferase